MCLCSTKKKQYPPLQPREGQYKKTNAYTQKPAKEQIFVFILTLLVIIFHSIFVVNPITTINQTILYILLALNYALICALIHTYIKITVFDPVDTFITFPEKSQNNKQQDPTYCNLCRSFVHQKSYHCKRCNRCTENFDHHCVFLNNCIGSRNYQMFIRLLLLFILFLVNNIIQCAWVFIVAKQNQKVKQAAFTQWMSIVIIILCSFMFLLTTALLIFHCYVSCCLDLTTLQFYQTSTQQNKSKRSSEGVRKSQSNEAFYLENKKQINQSHKSIIENQVI